MATQFYTIRPILQSLFIFSFSNYRFNTPKHIRNWRRNNFGTAVRTMLGEVLTKMNELDTTESTMAALSTSVEEIKVESARAKRRCMQ